LELSGTGGRALAGLAAGGGAVAERG
jgi:hypothetical protein